ncbi:MAG: dephospho-CoA kinase [Hyphomicrobium sp.]
MLIVGLTGSIGMGKSTAAARLRSLGSPVFDADAEVHRLYEGPLAAAIDGAFPGVTVEGRVDRVKLSAALVASSDGFRRLEHIVHPAVRAHERAFLRQSQANGAEIAVLEIPLLFESGADALVDVVIVVSADPVVQRRRALQRPGMTAQKLDAILARQTPDAEKRRRADFVVDGAGSVEDCNRQIDAIVAALEGWSASAFDAHWR